MTNRKLISIVSPCYNEQDNVQGCYEAVKAVFERELPQYDYEHLFADNASTDGTLSELRRIAADDGHVRVIANARNYGPFRSIFNALRATRGDGILVMLPVDLQDPPELIPEFVREWERGYKIIYGQRIARVEGRVMQWTRKFFYRLVGAIADFEIPNDTGSFQFIDRQVANAVLRFDDHYPYVPGMIANVGFRNQSKSIPYKWKVRAHGKTKHGLPLLVDIGLNGLISFTNVPMRLAGIAGFILALGAMLYAFGILVYKLVDSSASPPGMATVIVALFFFSGVQLLFIGLLGEYIGAIHSQVRQGGTFIEAERINFEQDDLDSRPSAEADTPRIGRRSSSSAQ